MSDNKRIKLRAAIEANRLVRLKLNDAFSLLSEYRKGLEATHGKKKQYLTELISALTERLEDKMDSINSTEHGGEIGGGGGGFSCGSDAGGD